MKKINIENLLGNIDPERLFIIALIVIILVILFFYIKDKSLNDIREDVYDLFLKAERLYTETGAGEEKLEWVADKAYNFLPWYIKLFVTRAVLKKIIDKWFKGIKDLLDDGKLNNSAVVLNDTESDSEYIESEE